MDNGREAVGALLVPVGAGDAVSREWITLRPGDRIGERYLLQELLDQSEVHGAWNAFDELVGRRVLLRLAPRPSLPDPRLRHPGFVDYVDRGNLGAWYVGVLDPGDGRDLRSTLQRLGALPVDVAVTIALDLLDALEHAHTQGMVHGHLSLDGVHVSPTWHARIVGFPEGFEPLLPPAQTLAAPERWTGQRGDERADVYAVGMLVHTLLTGRPPFGEGPAAREGHFLERLPPDPAIPAGLLQVLRLATDRIPALRYPTAGTLRAALGSLFARPTSGGVRLDPTTEVTPVPPALESWIGPAATLDPAPQREEHRESTVLPALLLLSLSVLAVGAASLVGAVALAVGVLSQRSPVQVQPAEPVVVPLRSIQQPPALPVQRSERVRVPVSFGYDSYEATPESGFRGFVRDARDRRGTLRLTGHTDDRGTPAANDLMGLGRAWSTSLLLVAEGVQAERIELASAGEREPIAPNDTPEGRAANRRVTADVEPSIQGILEGLER